MIANANGSVTGMISHCGTNKSVRTVTGQQKAWDSELLDGLSEDDKLAYFSNGIPDSDIKLEHERTMETSKLRKDTDVLFGVELQFETGGETHKVPEIPIRKTTTVAELKADYKGAAPPEDFHLYQLELWDKGERK